MSKTEVIETVTPVIEVPDSVLGFTADTELAFKIGKYTVNAEYDPEYSVTQYRLSIGSLDCEQESLYSPSAENAQAFLYEVILKGIFEEGTLEVVAR